MENEDAQHAIRLLEQIHEIQAANLEVQRKLLETVVAQYARNEETSKKILERATQQQDRTKLLQDRSMELLIMNRRILSYGLAAVVVVAAVVFWVFAFSAHR